MEAINSIQQHTTYISKYYKLSKQSLYGSHLSVKVCLSAYNQYYDLFFSHSEGRQKSYFAEQLTRLFFYLHLNWLMNSCVAFNLSTKELMFTIRSNNVNQIARYKSILIDLNCIECSRAKETYYKNGFKLYKEGLSSYNLLEQISSIDLSSSKYKTIEYEIPSYSVHRVSKGLDKFVINYSNIGITPILPYIEESSSELLDSKPIDYTQRCNHYQYTLDTLLSTYQRLEYRDLSGGIFASETMKLQANPAVYKSDGDKRIYHYFHSLPSDVRNKSITLNGEYITECFDVHNAGFCFLYCLLDDTVEQAEKDRYYNLVMSGKFYEDVRDWVNRTMNTSWDREYAKINANAYINLPTSKVERALKAKKSANAAKICVYKYFEDNYPSIHRFICINKDNNLHKRINSVETSIMFNIGKTLFEKYGIESLTLHDALYITKGSARWLSDNNLTTKEMFKESIDCYHFIDKF